MFTGPFAYGFGTQEILIIGVVVLVLFGGAKFAQMGKGLGEGIREFKKSLNPEEEAAAAAAAQQQQNAQTTDKTGSQ